MADIGGGADIDPGYAVVRFVPLPLIKLAEGQLCCSIDADRKRGREADAFCAHYISAGNTGFLCHTGHAEC